MNGVVVTKAFEEGYIFYMSIFIGKRQFMLRPFPHFPGLLREYERSNQPVIRPALFSDHVM